MKLFLVAGLLIIIISARKIAFRKSGTVQAEADRDLVRSAVCFNRLAKIRRGFVPGKENGKWGYINNRLEMVIISYKHNFEFTYYECIRSTS
ncbi:hypothetical protein [Flavitalea sp.]|nr:hypothetical protein [Flavitalea sp.]